MGVADLGVYFLVLPSRCGGFLVTEHFAFRPVDFGDFAYTLVNTLNECGVLPMLHIAGVGRFVISKDLGIRLLVWLGGQGHARFRPPSLSALATLIHLARRIKCGLGVCDFYGDLSLLDLARFRYVLPIEYKVLPAGPTL
ncbi:hypothetical protein [Vulcanisaeta sp. JCM 14467]|uniref:hypothetical protein n=1 Tax=Vulcanisaeta sp. JCM 14467 TaxID=1295370 RepID=UPI0006CF9749|nr:hypothetical protein [Vulcanisaeta sp. JCM 14467]